MPHFLEYVHAEAAMLLSEAQSNKVLVVVTLLAGFAAGALVF